MCYCTQTEVDHDPVQGGVEESHEHGQSHGDDHAHADPGDPHAGEVHPLVESVQQSLFRSGFSFQHFDLQNDMEIVVQTRRTVIAHLRPIF